MLGMCLDMEHGSNTFKLLPMTCTDLHDVEHPEDVVDPLDVEAASVAVEEADLAAAVAVVVVSQEVDAVVEVESPLPRGAGLPEDALEDAALRSSVAWPVLVSRVDCVMAP